MVTLDILHGKGIGPHEHHEFCAITTAANYSTTGEHMSEGDVAFIVGTGGVVYRIERVS